ncbi:MAG TPA: DUF5103 domain-containing protein [Bacteroidales bacterium]|nr:DUF5103 domain-containing protein [Bacteroidales bacterium]
MLTILMPYRKQLFLLSVALIFINNLIFSINPDSIACIDKVYEKNLKTVRLHPPDWESGYPVLDLNSDNYLLFNFDQIESPVDNFYYTFIHCTYNWQPSNLMFFEYADGFEENEILDYEESQSTFVQYTHFTLEIPNTDVSLTKSGNYLLVVYSKNDDNIQILITKRFMIYENIVEVTGRINPCIEGEYRKAYQKLDFTVLRKGINIYDAQSELKPVVLQNYQWNNALFNLPYNFIDNERISYEWDDKSCFDASNEYRYFNFNNLELNSERVENIEFKKPYYYISLVNDKSEMFSPYRSSQDINGSYVIRTNRFANKNFPEIQSEYAIVKFSLEYNTPINNADIYLYGDLTGYEINENSKLLYNLESRSYEKLLFLKQGYYNYKYLLVDKDVTKSPDHSFFEGSHQQTENNYLLLLYYREIGSSYDRLIYFSVFNSVNK